MTLYLNIGSNKGDRRSNLLHAVASIKKLPWIIPGTTHLSTIISSAPWGFQSHNTFLNIGLAADIHPDTPPLTILDDLLSIQHSISQDPHRDTRGNYIDRTIDIDIIAIDNLIYNHPRLTIPHPRMHLRDFVLIPMRQLAPHWTHPILGSL